MVKSIELIVQKCGEDEHKAHKLVEEFTKNWYVYCSITSEPTSLPDLKYWNVELNEIYKDAEVGLSRHEELRRLTEEKQKHRLVKPAEDEKNT